MSDPSTRDLRLKVRVEGVNVHKKVILAATCLTGWLASVSLAAPDERTQEIPVSGEDFKKWIRQEVIDLLTDEECFIAWHVKSAEQRSLFVRQFWDSRNPNPYLGVNEFRSEYDFRKSYAKDHFRTSKRERSQTDRGRIFVLLGPPDWIKPYWPRRIPGGCCSTFPFEVWRYDKVVVRGHTFEDLELEFVDPSMDGEYRLALGPEEKALFLREPCM